MQCRMLLKVTAWIIALICKLINTLCVFEFNYPLTFNRMKSGSGNLHNDVHIIHYKLSIHRPVMPNDVYFGRRKHLS